MVNGRRSPGERSPSFGNTSTLRGVRDRDELKAIDKQRFLELVRHAQLVAAVPRRELVAAQSNVFVGIRGVADAGRDPGAHFAASHEVGDELEARAVPRKQERARRRLAIELDDCGGAGRIRFGLKNARRPEHADDIGARAAAEAEHDVGGSSGRRRGRHFESIAQAACPQLDLCADRAAVADAGVEPHAYRLRSRDVGRLRVSPEPDAAGLQLRDRRRSRHRHRRRPPSSRLRCHQVRKRRRQRDAVTSDHDDPSDRQSRGPPGVNANRSSSPSPS